jgi:hypothetical protein
MRKWLERFGAVAVGWVVKAALIAVGAWLYDRVADRLAGWHGTPRVKTEVELLKQATTAPHARRRQRAVTNVSS